MADERKMQAVEPASGSTPRKTVLVGVTGCIAAYKTCEIVRLLQKAGVRVKVVMTEHATEFVGPTTFRALTHETVAVGLFDDPSDPIHHVSLAQEADAFLVAPCTANVIAKIANGLADDLLTTTALATTSPLIIAPAMNVNMYENGATRYNIGKLHIRGVRIVEAGDGYLACGDVGKGRLAEPLDIVAAVLEELGVRRDLTGRHVLVTAGPTIEPIDPVRYITNHSSGKTGYAIARAAALRGADVTLVSGPVSLSVSEGVHVVHVRTARDMFAAAQESFATADIGIFSAAVADMRPREAATCKLKKGTADADLGTIELIENPDILATLAAGKREGQVVVGFAAETNDVVANAQKKLRTKHADLIVGNEVGEGRAFGTDDNEVWFVSAEETYDLPLMSKERLADEILDRAVQFLG
ncbi:MAG: bifunctional phosphopantothenoylcysteine decarboxylase/phosphopantothenate--cysteine ligase CoaBC [Gordonibacter sp.]|nr:bifunctional phosphopantothenoylcysteine decarboxylase/phosphopantothenate--cysteine ligase CoaBC [Gordonibacter sp.]